MGPGELGQELGGGRGKVGRGGVWSDGANGGSVETTFSPSPPPPPPPSVH